MQSLDLEFCRLFGHTTLHNLSWVSIRSRKRAPIGYSGYSQKPALQVEVKIEKNSCIHGWIAQWYRSLWTSETTRINLETNKRATRTIPTGLMHSHPLRQSASKKEKQKNNSLLSGNKKAGEVLPLQSFWQVFWWVSGLMAVFFGKRRLKFWLPNGIEIFKGY